MSNIQDKAAILLKELDITKLKEESKHTNILLQHLLQKLMLSYTVDISEQVMLKQEEVITSYPSELVSSLKVIADLYLKMKDENKTLEIEEEKNSFSRKYVF